MTERGVSMMSIYIIKFVPGGFQTPDNFSFKFSSLKIRILFVLYILMCSSITVVYLQRLRIKCPTLWLQIMLFGNSQSPTATEFYMLITRRFFFRVVKLLASSMHNSMPITDEPSNSVSYSYMYTTFDGCVVAALHNVTSWHVTLTFRGRCEFA